MSTVTGHTSYRVIKKYLYTRRLQYTKLPVMFKVSTASLQMFIEGKIKGQIEVKRTRGRRRKKLLDDLKDRRGYCQLKREALDRTMWRNRIGRGFGPVD